MPTLPKRPCSVPGCSNYALRGTGRCAEHTRMQPSELRKEIDLLYKTGRWRRLRADQLRTEPLCAECLREGRLTDATECDHIIPHKGDKRLFFDRKNLQSLCKKHHSAKTAREDGGFGNPRSRRHV